VLQGPPTAGMVVVSRPRPAFDELRLRSLGYAEVKEHPGEIGERLRSGSMPCDRAWPREQIELFQRWVDSGMPE
jgi:hypothetical protein